MIILRLKVYNESNATTFQVLVAENKNIEYLPQMKHLDMASTYDVKQELEKIVSRFVTERKQQFSGNLKREINKLTGQVDNTMARSLGTIDIGRVVDIVSDNVVNNVVKAAANIVVAFTVRDGASFTVRHIDYR